MNSPSDFFLEQILNLNFPALSYNQVRIDGNCCLEMSGRAQFFFLPLSLPVRPSSYVGLRNWMFATLAPYRFSAHLSHSATNLITDLADFQRIAVYILSFA